MPPPSIAVLIPCYNEATTIGRVVSDFSRAFPLARIYVYDNNSNDGTAVVAARAGAIVRRETLQGKGNVIRRMFADIEADVYVLADGDGTYDAEYAPRLVGDLVANHLDFVNGRRVTQAAEQAYRRGHQLGNLLLARCVAWVFGNRIRDMLSGYKVLSRRFVKSFPALSTGFEIETELTVHALELQMPMSERDTPYYARPEGSVSKLRTYRDGGRILRTIFRLIKEERPLQFFFAIFLILFFWSLSFGGSVVLEFVETGFVPRLPTAVLALGLMLLAFLLLGCGLVLDTVTLGRRELKRLHYLQLPACSGANSDHLAKQFADDVAVPLPLRALGDSR